MEPRDLFARLEAANGLPEGLLDGMWAIESSRGKHLRSPVSSAAGHFQFMPETAKRYGLTNPHDLTQSAQAAARLAKDSVRVLSGVAEVNPGNLYLVHQQGPAGAKALLTAPNELAVDVLTSVYGSRKRAEAAIKNNAGDLKMTAGDFANRIASKFYEASGRKPPTPQRPADELPTPTPAQQNPLADALDVGTGFARALFTPPAVDAARVARPFLDALLPQQTSPKPSTPQTPQTHTPSEPGRATAFLREILSSNLGEEMARRLMRE